jgi:hypothetical protein
MIRPLTILTFLLACGSGGYLYQSKHEVQLLDRTIERTVRETNALREQSRLVAAEWTMLNDPERLRQFSDTYLTLKTITPSQFTSLADLNNRLPAPRAEVPAAGTDEQETIPVAGESGPQPVPEPAGPAVAEEILPVPPIPVLPPAPVFAIAARPADVRTPVSRMAATDVQPSRSVADARPPEPRAPEQRASARVAETRTPGAPQPVVVASAVVPYRPAVFAAPRPQPYSPPASVPAATAQYRPAMVATSAPAPYAGSLLGMARGSMPPAPRPMPVSATYNAN